MAENFQKDSLNMQDLVAERLHSTEQNISEMENILSLMDEIDAMKKNAEYDGVHLKELENTVGGYSRVEILNLIDDLKEKREKTLTDIDREKKALELENKKLKDEMSGVKEDISRLTQMFAKQIEINRMDNKANILDSKASILDNKVSAMNINSDKTILKEKDAEIERLKLELLKKDSLESFNLQPVKDFMSGDNTLVYEGMYNNLSEEIEKLKQTIRVELGYSYEQQQAIYENLAESISKVNNFDFKNFEEKLTEISQLKSTDIKVLEDRITENSNIDYDVLAQKLADKINENKLLIASSENKQDENAKSEINYDLLADKLADKIGENKVFLASGGNGVISANNNDEKLDLVTKELKELKESLNAILKNNDSSEFTLIDYEISEYLSNISANSLKDLLIDARNLKNKAIKFIENGNDKNGNFIIEGLKNRLKKVMVSGSGAVNDIITVMDNYHIPLSVNRPKLLELKNLFFKYEQGSIVPNEELINDIIRSKKETFIDTDLTVFDKQTFDEIKLESKNIDLTQKLNEETTEILKNLKKELMSFSLCALFDFDINIIGGEITDTDLLLKEIKELKNDIKNRPEKEKTMIVGEEDISSLTSELNEIAKIAGIEQTEKTTNKMKVKTEKKLRPSISSKDSETDKKPQPLATRRNKIDLNNGDDSSLSSILVQKLAVNMANKFKK